jgi:hypothetical protein
MLQLGMCGVLGFWYSKKIGFYYIKKTAVGEWLIYCHSFGGGRIYFKISDMF